MSYSKQTWQTGETITAERLNHIEDGITSAQVYTESEETLFSGDLTFQDNGEGIYFAEATVDISGITEPPESITVVFDGTEYTCPMISPGVYGAEENDWSTYPFAVSIGDSMAVLSETAGTHSVVIKLTAKTMSQDLADALKKLILVVDVVVTVGANGTASIDSQEVVKTLTAGGIVVYRAVLNGRIVVRWIPYTLQGDNIYLSVQSTDDYQHSGKVLINSSVA